MRKTVYLLLLSIILIVNIYYTIPLLKWNFKIINYISKFEKKDRIYEVERYSGYDNVVQYVKNGDALFGNSVIINTLGEYSSKFGEFYNFSYLSQNKVFYAPIHIAMNKNFFESKKAKKMIILTQKKIFAFYEDSIFETYGIPIQSYVNNDTITLIWQYRPFQPMRLYISDKTGKILYSKVIPANEKGHSIYEINICAIDIELKKGHYYWTVSRSSYARFLQYPGEFVYE